MLIARVWLTITILNTGLYKISHYADTANMMTAMGIPATLLPFAILMDIGGSIAIIFGFLTRILSLIMIGYVIACVILFKLDPHLTLSELSWMGGLFLLVFTGAGKYSIDAWMNKIASK